MAGAGEPWQLEFEKVEQRCGYLLTSGQWSDCFFMVGSETNQEVIQAHKLVLAMATPVFEAMFYGGLSERNDSIVPIPDIQPEAFRALLQYIYTGNINIGSFDMALDLWYGAKKYMLPHLVKQCTSYICSVVGPRNACRAYELACLFEEKLVVDKCIQIISTKTKEVLDDSSFVDVELKTLITVCSFDHLNVDSELDLFHAVARYAEAEQRRQRQISPVVEGEPPSKKLRKSLQHLSACDEKVLLLSVESSSKTSPAPELDSKIPTEMVTSEPTADKQNFKEEEASIRGALQKIRFLSMSAAQFAEGPARSGLLTKDETLALLMNIASRDSAMPVPTGFSQCREPRQPRQPRTDSLKRAAEAAADILCNSIPLRIQPALDKGILDALVPALTEGSVKCKEHAARAVFRFCGRASPAQLCVLAVSAALRPYCRLLADPWGCTCQNVLLGLTHLLKRVKQKTKPDLLRKLRALGVPPLLITVRGGRNIQNRSRADNLLRTYFSNDQ